MNDKTIAKKISQLMLDKKAIDIQIISVKDLTSITDFFVNCTSQSEPQTRAIKNHIQDSLFEKYKMKPLHIEGYENLTWILMDYVSIVVNIFSETEREYYSIERLWSDAKITKVKE